MELRLPLLASKVLVRATAEWLEFERNAIPPTTHGGRRDRSDPDCWRRSDRLDRGLRTPPIWPARARDRPSRGALDHVAHSWNPGPHHGAARAAPSGRRDPATGQPGGLR